MRSRNAIISLNFHLVSMWSTGNGTRLGKKALRARCSRTEESLPIEYIITGRSKLAATSRKISMLSDSRALRWLRRLGFGHADNSCVEGIGAGDTLSGRRRQGPEIAGKVNRNGRFARFCDRAHKPLLSHGRSGRKMAVA